VEASPIIPAFRVSRCMRNDVHVLTPDNNQETGRPSHFWSSKEGFDMYGVILGTFAQELVSF
jgi:hypothetical protein